MSAIYFERKSGESVSIRGSERAYMGLFVGDFARSVFGDPFWDDQHPMERVLGERDRQPFVEARRMQIHQQGNSMRLAIRSVTSMMGYDPEFTFTHEGRQVRIRAFPLTLNTLCVTGSPYLALLARLHGQCEIHCWISEENQPWLAGVIEQGRKASILRVDMGWERVAEMMADPEPGSGPVVCSYSVTDGFPHMPSDFESEYSEEIREERWYALPEDERWDRCFATLQGRLLEITPDNLCTPFFGPDDHEVSVFDLVASPEWLGRS